MRDILVTSSVLILALLVLRQAFRRTISRRVQYALWGLVLLRLLVPVNLPAMEHNVLTTAEPVEQMAENRLGSLSIYMNPVAQGEAMLSRIDLPDGTTPAVVVRDSRSTLVTESDFTVQGQSADAAITSEDGTFITYYAKSLTLNEILAHTWYAGIAVMACWLVVSNLRFWRKLRKVRFPYSVENCRYPVYMVGSGLPSPCLFGLFRPAIYLTPAAASSPESLRHVLAHETTHARHLDPLWSLLRGVCLAVYWFDPLVWTAAVVSKADCELACDEGALKRLGQDERVAYGRTLLALIPVAKRPADPMLAATTMTSGKRRLKDRITRIAENRQSAAAALFAVVAAAALLCAVTFTGAKAPGSGTGVRLLTGAELEYFNEEFFNGGGFNIRNQFLSSVYETPEDIDLCELFYCGIPFGEIETADQSDITAGWTEILASEYGGVEPDCPTYALSTTDMDALLKKYTGLTVAETNGAGLENFTYLAEYDAYYWAHGDTNYRGNVTIAAGERKNGLVCLYYYDDYKDEGWKCVSLRETEDGYHFVSNRPSGQPAIPTVYPEWAPELTISLMGLTPYKPPAVTVERHTDDCEKRMGGYVVDDAGHVVRVYRSTDGNVYAAVVRDEDPAPGTPAIWESDCFLTLPDGEYSFGHFSGLFGHDGVSISYNGTIRSNMQSTGRSYATITSVYGQINDYFYFTDDGTPVLLARAYGDVCVSDLDGDSEFELAASAGGPAQLFFQRDGAVYCADIEELVENAWPDAQHLSFGQWDAYSRSLRLSGEVAIPGAETRGTAFRDMYFDGEHLLLYKDRRAAADHAMEGIEAPEDVLASAKTYVRSLYDERETSAVATEADYDGWRIESLSGPYYETAGGLRLEIWRLNYELHTATPDQVILAGGRYITEDGWVSPGYPDCDYLYFQLAEDGGRTYLYSAVENDCAPGSELFFADMVNLLTKWDLLDMADLSGEELAAICNSHPGDFFNRAGEMDGTKRQTVLKKLADYVAGGGTPGEDAYAGWADHLQRFDSGLTAAGQQAWEALQAYIAAVPTALEAHVQSLMEEIAAGETVSLTLTTAGGAGGRRYTAPPKTSNSSNRVSGLTWLYGWTYANSSRVPAGADTLLIESGDGALSFQFWSGSDLVLCKQRDILTWYRAVDNSGGNDVFAQDIFSFMRVWYDEMEWEMLTADIVIPDRGQDRLEIAQAWVEQYEGTALQVTRGSTYAYSYFRAADVHLSDTVTEEDGAWDPPAPITDEPWFLFWYTGIFVPENQEAMRRNYAGNTGDYDGAYGEAPEGALSYGRCGYMYLTEKGWRCGAVGTGP